MQRQPVAYLIFWGAHWSNQGILSADGQLVEQYFQDVGGTPFANILTQYHDPTGSISNALQFGGAWIDTSAPPTDLSCVQPTVHDAAIQSEVANAITTNNWPENGNATYFVYTPPGVAVNDKDIGGGCSSQLYILRNTICGYHFYLSSINVAYAEIPYPSALSSCQVPQSPNGNKAADSMINITSHEQFEAITDPQVLLINGGLTTNSWIDANGQEISDKCAWQFPTTPTHLNNGGVFELQEEYSNATSSCADSYTSPSVYVGSANGVYAFDPTTGVRLWRYLAPCGVSSPAVANGIVYFGACSTVYALNAATSTLLWSDTLGGNLAPGAPVISNGLLYVGADEVYALNPSTGALVWKTAAPNGSSQLVVGNGEVFVTSSPPYTGVLTALNATTGIQLWQKTYSNDSVGSLTYDNGEVFIAISQWFCTTAPCGGMQVYDAATGIRIWSNNFGLSVPPAGANGVLYTPDSGSLIAYDESLGIQPWGATVSATANINATPVIANGIAYLSLSDGSVVAFNLSSKTTAWSYLTGASIQSAPTVMNGVVYVGSSDTYTYALDASAGTLLWHTAAVSGVTGPPAMLSSQLTVSPGFVVARAALNNTPTSQVLTITDPGQLSANWSVSSALPAWLQMSSTSGTIAPGASERVTLKFLIANTALAQSMSTTLVLADGGATGTPLDVTVTAVIGPTNTLFVGSANGVYAFDPTTGVRLWRYLAPCGVSSPAVANGIVYFGACSTVYALNAATSTLLWSDTLGGNVQAAPVVSNGLVYVSADEVYALHASTGALAWMTAAPSYGNQPVLGGGALFVASGSSLTALNAATGAQLWQVNTPNYAASALAYDNGEVFDSDYFVYCSVSPCGGMRAYDATTGIRIWGNNTLINWPPATLNGVLYVPDSGSLIAYDESVGTLLWGATVSATANINATPVIANGIAYLSLSDGSVVAFNLSSKTIVWQSAAQTAPASQVVSGDGFLFVQGGYSQVYALDPATGNLVWSEAVVGYAGNQPTPALG